MFLFTRQAFLSTLFILFGISAWVTINGVWAETPLLVNKLPEGWKLASYIIIITQLANCGPILLYFIKKKFPNCEKIAIHFVLFIGIISCLLLGTFWDKTVFFLGKERSLYFFIFVFAFAFLDCTSSVLYIPYMRYYKNKYIFPFFVGEGLSGLVPSLLSFAQGTESKKHTNLTREYLITDQKLSNEQSSSLNFGISTYICLLALIVLISWISFVLLNLDDIVKDERILNDSEKIAHTNTNSTELLDENPLNIPLDDSQKKFVLKLSIMQAFICCLTNGIMTALQTYTAKPYGNLPYRLACNLALISNPFATLIGFLLEKKFKIQYVYISMSLATTAALYLFTLALQSPHPFLVNTNIGSFLMILSWITFTGFFSFSKTMIASILRKSELKNSLVHYGAFTQIGSFVGAVFSFTLINFTNLFKSY